MDLIAENAIRTSFGILLLLAACLASKAHESWLSDGQQLTGPVTDFHLKKINQLKIMRFPTGNRSKSQAVLIAEGQDVVWADEIVPRVVQSLRLGASSHRFQVLGVECGNSICQIRALGDDSDSLPDWERLIEDIKRQEWNDFNKSTAFYEVIDGQFVILNYLFRQSSEFGYCIGSVDTKTCEVRSD